MSAPDLHVRAPRMVTRQLRTDSAEATEALGAALARRCTAHDCILLRGGLGAGKTSFARGFILALCSGEREILSPTFTIVQHYRADTGDEIRHFDLYRLEQLEELREIGLEEAASGISLVEWPELACGLLPADALDIHIGHAQDAAWRDITLCGQAAVWQARLDALRKIA